MSLRDEIRKALTPTQCTHPTISMERVEVTGLGMVQGVLDDEPRPIDGDTGTSGAGMALTIDGHRHFLPFRQA